MRSLNFSVPAGGVGRDVICNLCNCQFGERGAEWVGSTEGWVVGERREKGGRKKGEVSTKGRERGRDSLKIPTVLLEERRVGGRD